MSVATASLSEVCNILSGFAWSASKFNQDRRGVPIIRIQNVDAVSDNDFVYWNEPYDERFVIRRGDLLLTLSGSFRIASWVGPDALLNQRIIKLTPSTRLDRGWLLHVLRPRLGQIERLGKHALVNNVSLADIRKLVIPLPPLAEQRRIAEILDKADLLRAKRRAAIARLDTLTQSIFLEMFGDPATNPKGLPTTRLGKACTRITDGTHQPPTWSPKGNPFLFVSNVINGEITFDTEKFISDETHAELTRRCPINVGDVLYSTVGSYGVPAVVRTTRKFAFQRHIAHLKPDRNVLDPEFLRAMLASPALRRQADQAARGVAQKTVNLADIREFLVFSPSLELQRDFSRRGVVIEQVRSAHRNSFAELDALFTSLQHRAFRGEL